ncbi:hypothetical protein BHE74_00029569 [Ensete ventricosum]|uniref:Uncharacterized protein n=1 Tax=Ensete ventricosum TaxID=4639 RepID=A0A426XCJ7_ENSVE|nr:hypothetical protein B296_00036227 [Ensete ventricosum]RWV93453.1 hypothetical protein GW17_00044084 [Ensete ventricosum]RWW63262.1 hypothetical protein BHE74_00029569 [Ensete ventricosum]RZS13719.1 hypothetical protein BHM03_00045339 [Ensete ventricosum]
MGAMTVDRADGRSANQLRPLACSRNILHRAHGSARWSQGNIPSEIDLDRYLLGYDLLYFAFGLIGFVVFLVVAMPLGSSI